MTVERELRQEQILKAIREQGRARVSDLCERFDASEATIRRDLDQLEESGFVKRIHGGAVAVKEPGEEQAVLQRLDWQAEEKRIIAREASSLVNDGDTIFLGSGSTVLYMLPDLKEKSAITVITNSLPVVNELVGYPECKTVVIGGLLRKSELSLVGHISVRTLEELRADKVFLGAEAVHPEHGLTNSYMEETMTDRAIVEISPQIIILADHEKFNKVHAAYWGPLRMVQLLITDWKTDRAILERLDAEGVRYRIARPET